MNRVAVFEPFMTAKECVLNFHLALNGSVGLDALTRLVKLAPYRVLPGGKRRLYRMSEVLPLVEALCHPQAAEQEDCEKSLHRRRRGHKSA